jgi:hypothetical protein
MSAREGSRDGVARRSDHDGGVTTVVWGKRTTRASPRRERMQRGSPSLELVGVDLGEHSDHACCTIESNHVVRSQRRSERAHLGGRICARPELDHHDPHAASSSECAIELGRDLDVERLDLEHASFAATAHRGVVREGRRADRDDVAGNEHALAAQLLAVDGRAVVAAEIDQRRLAVVEPQLGVTPRGRSIVEVHRAPVAPADGQNVVFA